MRSQGDPSSPPRLLLSAEELAKISAATLQYYDQNAEAFWEGTQNHDVSQNRSALLEHLEGKGPFSILDFGCGPGRDLRAFRELGHEAVGLEGSRRFVEMARAHSGCEVWNQDFLDLQLPEGRFDGIFANAALFHVPGQELPRVLEQLWMALKPGGVLFSSNPHGNNEEGWSGNRYGAFYNLKAWRAFLTEARFVELDHYYRPAGLPRGRQPWLATLWRKSSSVAR